MALALGNTCGKCNTYQYVTSGRMIEIDSGAYNRASVNRMQFAEFVIAVCLLTTSILCGKCMTITEQSTQTLLTATKQLPFHSIRLPYHHHLPLCLNGNVTLQTIIMDTHITPRLKCNLLTKHLREVDGNLELYFLKTINSQYRGTCTNLEHAMGSQCASFILTANNPLDKFDHHPNLGCADTRTALEDLLVADRRKRYDLDSLKYTFHLRFYF